MIRTMNITSRALLAALLLALAASQAVADEYEVALEAFRNAGESGAFFDKSHGYAVFPTIGKGGIGVGAAHGTGRVYEQGKLIAHICHAGWVVASAGIYLRDLGGVGNRPFLLVLGLGLGLALGWLGGGLS